MTREIEVDVVGDASKFGKTIDQATTKTSGFGSKLKGLGTGVSFAAATAAFSVVGTAISGAISLLGDAHQAFKDDQVSATNMATAIKNSVPGAYEEATAAAEAFAGAQGAIGFADDEVRESLSQLVGVTHDVEEAQKLASLAMDLARAKGVDLATATDAVNKAYNGQGKALAGMGIDISGATSATELLAAAQRNAQGAAEAFAQTSEGRTAASQVKVGEAMEKVGAAIDQVSQVVLPLLADGLSGIIDVFTAVWTAIQPVVSALLEALGPAFRTAGEIGKSVMAAIIGAVRAVAPVFQTVFGIIGGILKVAGAAFDAWKAVVSTVLGVIGNLISVWVNAVKVYFSIVGNALGVLGKVFGAFRDLVGRVFGAVAGIVKGAINGVIGIINGVIGAINAIQVHIHMGPVDIDWNGLNIGKIPKLHQGGVVPGPQGKEVMIKALAGEEVSRVGDRGGRGRGGGVTVIVEQFMGSDTEMERFGDRVAYRLLVAETS